MAEDKNPIDQLLDLVVYGPLGALVTVALRYPQLVEQGRAHLEAKAGIGRLAAQFAMNRGQQEAQRAFERLRQDGEGASRDAFDRDDVLHSPGIADEEVIPVRHDDDDPVTAGSVGEDELAIPAYDSLAASQVVQRLDGLTADELEAVRRYEIAHRARKTVLGKIAQLQR